MTERNLTPDPDDAEGHLSPRSDVDTGDTGDTDDTEGHIIVQ
jgi:hypothetical protein